MKLITTLILFLLCNTTSALTYYVSGEGNDSNSGLTTSAPKATIAGISSFLTGGNTILFERGYIYSGKFIITGANVTIADYGTGAKPVIDDMAYVMGWVNVGGNIWEAPVTGVSKGVNMVTKDDVVMQVGRYPNRGGANDGYLTHTAITTTSLTGPALSTTTNWTNAQCVIKITAWEIIKRKVSSHSGGTVNFYVSLGSPRRDGFGYFFQRDPRTLDQNGEWYHDTAANKLRVFSTDNPGTHIWRISIEDTMLYCNQNGITIKNIDFIGSNEKAILLRAGASGAVIRNSTFKFHGGDAVAGLTYKNITVDSCNFSQTMATAIRLTSPFAGYSNYYVTNNFVDSTAMFPGMEDCDRVATNSMAVRVYGDTNINIINNRVRWSGWSGIEWQGSSVRIRNNLVDNYCSLRDDGGGIYTVDVPPASRGYRNYHIRDDGPLDLEGIEDLSYINVPIRYNRVISGNICIYGIGAVAGTDGAYPTSTRGLYSDLNTAFINYDSNTVAYNAGAAMHGNNNSDLKFRYNNFYNNHAGYSINRYDSARLTKNMVITDNVIYRYRWTTGDLGINFSTPNTFHQRMQGMGTIGNNKYYLRVGGVDTTLYFVTTNIDRSNYKDSVKTMSYIQTMGLQELGSTRVNAADSVNQLQYNWSDTVMIFKHYNYSKKDPYGVVYNGTTSIQPHRSVILFNNGTCDCPDPGGSIPPPEPTPIGGDIKGIHFRKL